MWVTGGGGEGRMATDLSWEYPAGQRQVLKTFPDVGRTYSIYVVYDHAHDKDVIQPTMPKYDDRK